MMTKQYRGNDGRKQGFQRRNRFENKSDAVMSSVEEKILATLRAEEIHDWGARRLLRKSGISNETAFYDALHSLKDKRLILMDRQHNVKLIPVEGDLTAAELTAYGMTITDLIRRLPLAFREVLG